MKVTTPGLLASVTVLLVLGAAFSAGLYTSTLRTPGDDSAEAGFARDMSTHHAQAVEMSMLAVKRSARDDLRLIAQDMALTQQAQIGTMRGWLRQWRLSPTGSSSTMAWMTEGGMAHDGMNGDAGRSAPMPGMATPEQLESLRRIDGARFDILFTQLMIKHHEGGVVMIDAILSGDPDTQVRELASSMRASQQYEIGALKAIQAKLSAAGR